MFSKTALTDNQDNVSTTEEVDYKALDFADIESKLLNPLTEILLISYGTSIFNEIIKRIDDIVDNLEKEHLLYKHWQRGATRPLEKKRFTISNYEG